MHPMVAELCALDFADADRDENAHRCDDCGGWRGERWFDNRWLCKSCRRCALAVLGREESR
jgi:hypothetical protein